jgi:hypothetical protein
MDKKTLTVLISPLFIAALILCSASALRAEEPVMLAPKLLYEISDSPASGFFQNVVSMAVDEQKGALYVLTGAPDYLAVYHNDDGLPWNQFQLDVKIASRDGVAACGGKVLILNAGGLFEMSAKGALAAPKITPSPLPKNIDEAFCDRAGRLVLVDKENLEIRRYDAKGKLDMTAANPADAGDGEKIKPPFLSIGDVATDVFGGLYAIDPKARSVVFLNDKGIPVKTVSGGGFSDVWFPFDSPSIAVDKDRNVWLINSADNTLDEYDSFGELMARIGNESDTGFRFTRPQKIFFDSFNRLYVLDSTSVSIKVFDLGQ